MVRLFLALAKEDSALRKDFVAASLSPLAIAARVCLTAVRVAFNLFALMASRFDCDERAFLLTLNLPF